MGAASIKIDDDGSFNCLVCGTDIGTGRDTVVGQIVTETLGVPLEDMITYSSDTDITSFDAGAHASSTAYITGGAAKKAAEKVRAQIQEVAARMFNKGYGQVVPPGEIDTVEYLKGHPCNPDPSLARVPVKPKEVRLHERCAWAPDGRAITLQQIVLFATHTEERHQIMAVASHMSCESPPRANQRSNFWYCRGVGGSHGGGEAEGAKLVSTRHT
jgi:putative selenate reductase molybdopterin-binding subunit